MGSTSSYSSVRSLDKYGQAQQLSHAREAAFKGRKILAATNGRGEIIVVSQGSSPILHDLRLQLASQSEESSNQQTDQVVAICYSGITGDATWLISQIQEYLTRVWERYNNHQLGIPSIAHYASRLMGSFLYVDNESEEWQSTIRRDTTEWARPLGIQVMLVSPSEPSILMIDPNGRVTVPMKASPWSICGIGFKAGVPTPSLSAIEMSDVARVTELLIKSLVAESSRGSIVEYAVETVTSSGIDREIRRFKNGKEII